MLFCRRANHSFMTELLHFDQYLFHLINIESHNAFLDVIMPYWRHKLFWFPLYLFIFTFLLLNYKLKGFYFIIAFVLTIVITDFVSSELIKKNIHRLRPCHSTELKEEVKLLVRCGSGFSFPSSHAANHMAIAVFCMMTLVRRKIYLKAGLLFWAISVAYGQVYVGVHYPFDVVGGAVLGGMIGYAMALIYQKMDQVKIEEFYTLRKT